jgi:hypothetical protein
LNIMEIFLKLNHKINNYGTNLTGIAYTSLLANVFY